MKTIRLPLVILSALLLAPMSAFAEFITLEKITGSTPQSTGVFRADLSTVSFSDLASITITDAGGTSGAAGVWSGFDLAGVRLSSTLCEDAACANSLSGLSVFDFGSGTIFTAGSMDATSDVSLQGPCLFGSAGPTCALDNSLATLSLFDASFSTPALSMGWLSLGRNGSISFNLTSSVSTTGLYLYVGEVGNNGENVSGLVSISDDIISAPFAGAVGIFMLGCISMGLRRNR